MEFLLIFLKIEYFLIESLVNTTLNIFSENLSETKYYKIKICKDASPLAKAVFYKG